MLTVCGRVLAVCSRVLAVCSRVLAVCCTVLTARLRLCSETSQRSHETDPPQIHYSGFIRLFRKCCQTGHSAIIDRCEETPRACEIAMDIEPAFRASVGQASLRPEEARRSRKHTFRQKKCLPFKLNSWRRFQFLFAVPQGCWKYAEPNLFAGPQACLRARKPVCKPASLFERR